MESFKQTLHKPMTRLQDNRSPRMEGQIWKGGARASPAHYIGSVCQSETCLAKKLYDMQWQNPTPELQFI